MENKGFFESINGKTGFYVGLTSGILAVMSIGFIIMLVLAFTGTGNVVENNQANKPSLDNNQQAGEQAPIIAEFDIDSKKDHIRGNKNAKITLVEFSDFECPFCSRFKPTINEVLKTYGDDVRVVFKHFPLDSIHPQARPAAIASECAFEQKGNDMFFKFHDEFFANQSKLGKEYFVQLAKDNKLNIEKFESCLQNPEIAARVENNLQEGIQKGVQGTPATFIDGELISGALPFQNFKEIIDSKLK